MWTTDVGHDPYLDLEEQVELTEDELDAINDAEHERWTDYELGISIVTKRDMDKCPKHSWNPRHYHVDGTCRCPERDRALELLSKATAMKRKADELYNNAKEYYRCT